MLQQAGSRTRTSRFAFACNAICSFRTLFGVDRLPNWVGRSSCLLASSATDKWMIDVAADLQRVTTPDQWTITDAQYAVALANRDTPPWLVDTSPTQRASGYLTSHELQQAAADARVHAVVFGTNHLASGSTARFHAWVTEQFKLLRANVMESNFGHDKSRASFQDASYADVNSIASAACSDLFRSPRVLS